MQRQLWFNQTPHFGDMMVSYGIQLIKIWLNVGRAEQLRRFVRREAGRSLETMEALLN